MSLSPAIFLDRDGTINVEKNYLYKVEDFEWTPGAPEAIKRLRDAGYKIIVVTNQAGIARGMYGPSDVAKLHGHMNTELRSIGTSIDAFYVCPHHPNFGEQRDCNCRKPKPGMLLQAATEYALDLSRSWLVGDKMSDVEAALAAGVKPLLVQTGYGASESVLAPNPEMVVADIAAACDRILKTDHPERAL